MYLYILFTDEWDGAFVLQMIGACTKLRVMKLHVDFIKRVVFSTLSFLTVLNKSTSLQTLSLFGVYLSDMVSHTVCDVYNVASPNCISLYYMYRMWRLLGISVELSSNLRTSQM